MESGRRLMEASCDKLIHQMVSLPRTISKGFSRVVDQGLDLMRLGGARRNHRHFLPQNFPSQHYHTQQHYLFPNNVDQEDQWAFLATFEKQFGTMHPFFYVCRFVEALKMAQNEHKFVFIYLHSLDHPFTHSFCKDTLCSEVVVQFLDENFVSWGGIANGGEGSHMCATFRPVSFPFCAVVALDSDENLVVIQQMEGAVSAAEVVEKLETIVEGQGLGFWGKDEEKTRPFHGLIIQEQTAPSFTSLQAKQKLGEDTTARKPQHRDNATPATQILIRFPNGERKEKQFLCTDKVQTIFKYIDSLGLSGINKNYNLISNFPKKVFSVDHMGMTLKDVGFHPKATLFIELV